MPRKLLNNFASHLALWQFRSRHFGRGDVSMGDTQLDTSAI